MLAYCDTMRELVQCYRPTSSVLGGGRDGLPVIVGFFWDTRTDYAREGEDRAEYRGLYSQCLDLLY